MSEEWGDWIGWNGGECPVEPDAKVQVVRAWEGISPPASGRIAGAQPWGDTEGAAAIIAYRVKREPRVETVRKEACVTPAGWILTGHAQGVPNTSGYRDGYTVYETRDGIPDMTTLRWEEV